MQTLESLYASARLLRPKLRPLFDWQFTGVIIGILIGAGMAMPFVDQYLLGMIFFAVGGISAAGFWLCSPFVWRRRTKLNKPYIRRDSDALKSETFRYRVWEWIPVVLLFISIGVACQWVRGVHWNRESSDALQNVKIEYLDRSDRDSVQTFFTVTNRTSHALSNRHLLQCKFRDVVYDSDNLVQGVWGWYSDRNKNWWIGPSPVQISSNEDSFPILPNGDAISKNCLEAMSFKGKTLCADTEVRFDFFLEDYPDRPLNQEIRLVSIRHGDSWEWRKTGLLDSQDYCAETKKRVTRS